MADSDPEYSDDDLEIGANGNSRSGQSTGRKVAARPKKAQAKWEASATRNFELNDGGNGIEGVIGGLEEASKRKRYACWVVPAMVQ